MLSSGGGLGATKVGENRLHAVVGVVAAATSADASSWVPVGGGPARMIGSATVSESAPGVAVMHHGLQQVGSAEHLDPMHGLLHVLVVDDDEAIRKACCKIAAGMGFAVVGADSATEARAILKHQRIDLLLLDL